MLPLQCSTVHKKMQYLIEMTQNFIAEVIAEFSLFERRTKRMWVWIFDVSDD